MQADRFCGAILLAIALAACGGGGGGSTTPSTPVATLSPAKLAVSPASVAYTSLGDTPQAVTITEAGYTGTYTISTASCANVAGATSTSATTFNVNPVGSGTCTIAVSDSYGQSAGVSVSVTQTFIGGH